MSTPHIQLVDQLSSQISEQMFKMQQAVSTSTSNESSLVYHTRLHKSGKNQFVLAFSSESDAAIESTLLGFAIISRIHETFMRRKVRISDLVVLDQTADHMQYHSVGSSLLRFVESCTSQWGCSAITSIIDVSMLQAQPLFAQAKWNAVGLFFSTPIKQLIDRPTRPTTKLRSAVISSSNFDTAHSKALLVNAQHVYRHLRTEFSQLPESAEGYLQVLREIVFEGPTFIVIAYESDETGDISLTNNPTVLGVGMCRPAFDVLHIDDLVTSEAHRSKGVGSFLLRTIATLVSEQSSDLKDVEVSSVKTITLESGFQRLDAHRFYWREGFFSTKLYWRKLISSK